MEICVKAATMIRHAMTPLLIDSGTSGAISTAYSSAYPQRAYMKKPLIIKEPSPNLKP